MRADASGFIVAVMREYSSYSAQVQAAKDIGLAANSKQIQQWLRENGILEHIIKNRASYGADEKLIEVLRKFLESEN
jgi:hypothetical protein